MRLLLAALASPLLGGCIVLSPHLSPVPLAPGRAEVSAGAGVLSLDMPSLDSNFEETRAKGSSRLLLASARLGMVPGLDVGGDVVRVGGSMWQGRVSGRWGHHPDSRVPVALLVSGAYQYDPGGYRAFVADGAYVLGLRHSPAHVSYAGLHLAAGQLLDSGDSTTTAKGFPMGGAGAFVGTDWQRGPVFVRAEGAAFSALSPFIAVLRSPETVLLSGVVTAGVRF